MYIALSTASQCQFRPQVVEVVEAGLQVHWPLASHRFLFACIACSYKITPNKVEVVHTLLHLRKDTTQKA